jgi:tRNA C32,U32 (ribose-2'-O)-methylase TrmJ
MRKRLLAPVIAFAAVIVLITVLLLTRDRLSERVYRRTGDELAERLDPKLRERYGEELRYTLDKFWRCYEDGIVTRNDLNEVMDRMRLVLDREPIEDEDVFNLIGLASRIYTDALRTHHDRELEQE